MISIHTFSPSLSVPLTCSQSLFLVPERPKCRYLYVYEPFLVKKKTKKSFFSRKMGRDVLKEREMLFFTHSTVKCKPLQPFCWTYPEFPILAVPKLCNSHVPDQSGFGSKLCGWQFCPRTTARCKTGTTNSKENSLPARQSQKSSAPHAIVQLGLWLFKFVLVSRCVWEYTLMLPIKQLIKDQDSFILPATASFLVRSTWVRWIPSPTKTLLLVC